VSDGRHPFHGEEYVVAGVTTTERAPAVELGTSDWAVGGLPRTSYVSPWFLTTLEHSSIDRGVGMVTGDTLDTVVTAVVEYYE
jgi:mRNA interferase MazF